MASAPLLHRTQHLRQVSRQQRGHRQDQPGEDLTTFELGARQPVTILQGRPAHGFDLLSAHQCSI
jgi:hypothetical protein